MLHNEWKKAFHRISNLKSKESLLTKSRFLKKSTFIKIWFLLKQLQLHNTPQPNTKRKEKQRNHINNIINHIIDIC